MYFRYGIPRALRQLLFNWRGAFNNVLILTASLAMSGMVALLYLNVVRISEAWFSDTTVSVFLRGGLSAHQRERVLEQVRRHPMVKNAVEVGPLEGLKTLAERLGADQSLLKAVGEDRLPYTIDFEVFLDYRERLQTIAEKFEGLTGVQDVVYAERVLDKVALFFRITKAVGWFFIALVLVSFSLIIANSTRLSLQSRRQEIEILHFSGAPRPFIRSAFVVEGVLLALAGWCASLAIIRVGFQLIVAGVTWDPATMPLKELSVFFSWQMLAGSLVAGLVLGALSSHFAVNSVLKELER